MSLQDLGKDLANQTDYYLERRIDELLIASRSHKNIDSNNRQLILNLLKKYREFARQGIKPSISTVKDDKYYLYENRFTLGLAETDLNQINELLDSLSK